MMAIGFFGYGNSLVEMLGYRNEQYDEWGWYGKAEEQFKDILKRENKIHMPDSVSEFQKKRKREGAINLIASGYKYVLDNYDELFENDTDIFGMEISFSEASENVYKDFEYKKDILQKLNDVGIKTSPEFSQLIKKIHEAEDVSKLEIEDLCPNISSQSPESEYYLSKGLREVKDSNEYNKREKEDEFLFQIFRRGIITSIAQAKGIISKEGDLYEPDIEPEDLISIIEKRFKEEKIDKEEFEKVGLQYGMTKFRIDDQILKQRRGKGEITDNEFVEELKKILTSAYERRDITKEILDNRLKKFDKDKQPQYDDSEMYENPFKGLDFSGVPDIDSKKEFVNPFGGLDFSGVPDIDSKKEFVNPFKGLDFSGIPDIDDSNGNLFEDQDNIDLLDDIYNDYKIRDNDLEVAVKTLEETQKENAHKKDMREDGGIDK